MQCLRNETDFQVSEFYGILCIYLRLDSSISNLLSLLGEYSILQIMFVFAQPIPGFYGENSYSRLSKYQFSFLSAADEWGMQ